MRLLTIDFPATLRAVRHRSETATTQPLGVRVEGLLAPTPPDPAFWIVDETLSLVEQAPAIIANARLRGQCRTVTVAFVETRGRKRKEVA